MAKVRFLTPYFLLILVWIKVRNLLPTQDSIAYHIKTVQTSEHHCVQKAAVITAFPNVLLSFYIKYSFMVCLLMYVQYNSKWLLFFNLGTCLGPRDPKGFQHPASLTPIK